MTNEDEEVMMVFLGSIMIGVGVFAIVAMALRMAGLNDTLSIGVGLVVVGLITLAASGRFDDD